jgi:pyocin large subunit-like protein
MKGWQTPSSTALWSQEYCKKTRVNGDMVRFDPATDAFGVVMPDGTIRTYYKPDPAVHGYPRNLDYYHSQ